MTLPLQRIEPTLEPHRGPVADSLAWLGEQQLPVSRAHFLTIDVEAPRNAAEVQGAMATRQVGAMLDLLSDAEVNATFFVSGAVAAAAPSAVQAIARAGHEVAARTGERTPWMPGLDAFRAEAWRLRCVIEDLTGQRVLGHRTQALVIGSGTEWAYDALLQDGYEYDSSWIPRPPAADAGPAAPSAVHVVRRWAGNLVEVPLTTVPVFGRPSPVMGGEWLRHLPYPVVRRALRSRERAGEPAVFALRSWELDPMVAQEGSMNGATRMLERVRDHRGLARTAPALARALREFPFTSIASRLAYLRRTAVPFDG